MPAKRPSFEAACRTYVHRFTMEHVPSWASGQPIVGKFYAPQFRTDKEWYDNTTFPGEAGHLGGRRHCHTSGQTWPLGKLLDAPYVKSD